MMNNKLCVAAAFTCAQEFLDINEMSESEGSIESDTEISTILEVLKKKNFHKKKNITRIKLYVEKTINNYSEQQFQQHFRLSRSTYELLISKISPLLSRNGFIGRHAINVEKQLLSVLATPDSYRSVSDRFDMGKSSLSVSFFRVVEALNDIAMTMITWPTKNQMIYNKQKFKFFAKLDEVIGAIDGTFIQIKAPKVDPEVYVTRKCNYAITLQAVSDCDLKFTNVFVGYPGSVSDTRIFKNSDLYSHVLLNQNLYFPNNEFILGDKAYPVTEWCIPPYIDHGKLTRLQKNFNEVHAKTRQTIERAFALLFGRFRRLKFLDMNRHDLIPATVLAACVLHNLCLDNKDLFREQYINDGMEMLSHNEEINDSELEPFSLKQAKSRRDQIARELFC